MRWRPTKSALIRTGETHGRGGTPEFRLDLDDDRTGTDSGSSSAANWNRTGTELEPARAVPDHRPPTTEEAEAAPPAHARGDDHHDQHDPTPPPQFEFDQRKEEDVAYEARDYRRALEWMQAVAAVVEDEGMGRVPEGLVERAAKVCVESTLYQADKLTGDDLVAAVGESLLTIRSQRALFGWWSPNVRPVLNLLDTAALFGRRRRAAAAEAISGPKIDFRRPAKPRTALQEFAAREGAKARGVIQGTVHDDAR